MCSRCNSNLLLSWVILSPSARCTHLGSFGNTKVWVSPPELLIKWCRVWPVCLPQSTEAAGTEPFRLSQRPQLAFPPISPPNQLATIPAEWIPHGTVSNPRLALHLPDFTGLGWGQVEIFLNPPGDPFAAVLPTSVLDTVTRAGQRCSCTLLFLEPTASAPGEEFSGLALLIHCPVRPPG